MDKPLPAYAGTEPFVFVCYSHADNALVYPEILRLQSQRFRIWYDDGIAPGSEWSEAIANAIENCSVFLYLITPNAVASEHCRREVNFALEQSCSMLAVHLTETSVPSALKLSLSHRQAILKYELPQERYEARIDKALSDASEGREDNGEGLTQALHIGDFVLDIASQRLIRGDDTHLLDPKDMSVLLHLAEASPGLVSTEELLNCSWPGAVVGDNVVHQVIGRLRKAFGDKARSPTYIETLPRRGYRLLKEVQPHEPSPRPTPVREPAPTPPEAPIRQPGLDPGQEPGPLTPKAFSEKNVLHRNRLVLAAVGLIVILAAAGLLYWLSRSSEPVEPNAIAVLNFRDFSVQDDLKQLAIDIPDFLASQLGDYREVYMLSRAATQRYRDFDQDIQEIGEELGVAFVLTGSVRSVGSTTFVTMELSDVANLSQKWSFIEEYATSAARGAAIQIAKEAAQGVVSSFQSNQVTLQIRQNAPAQTSKPSLRDVLKQDSNAPASNEFPSFDEVEMQSFDDFGDVE